MHRFILLTLVFFASSVLANPQQDYLTRFQTYQEWNHHFPTQATHPFLKFIKQDTPLANKLRERWLAVLGQKKDWKTYKHYYKKSEQTHLNCYAALADFYSGQSMQAMNTAKSLWLSGASQPGACRELFEIMLKQPNFDERYIDARIILALNETNLPLVSYLLKQYRSPKLSDVTLFENIIKKPSQITQLPREPFYGYFYVYGLKQLVATKKLSTALTLWQQALQEKRLTEPQEQQFLAYFALYKSLREDEDAPAWFAKVRPVYYTDALLDWQIRLALKQLDWVKVGQLIPYYQNKADPCWQYWLARAMEAQGKTQAAKAIYESLAKTRQYYGFLASLRLNHPLQFESEKSYVNLATLRSYQSITDQISYLHQQKREGEASQLLNDFTSELPKDEKITLIHWVGNVLKWYGKSIAMSSNDDLKNQLVLRFPLAHREVVSKMAASYHLPEAFIYAIIRQESTFRADIVSPAGARGLMQLMPATASLVAKSKHVPYRNQKELFHYPTNIHLGSAYLETLSRRFSNHPVLMAAAYNAGPSKVVYWLKNHTPQEIDIWIETLPWRETRNYLKNVIAFYAVYQYRIQERAGLEDIVKPLRPKDE